MIIINVIYKAIFIRKSQSATVKNKIKEKLCELTQLKLNQNPETEKRRTNRG